MQVTRQLNLKLRNHLLFKSKNSLMRGKIYHLKINNIKRAFLELHYEKSPILLGTCLLTAACSTTSYKSNTTTATSELKTAGQLNCLPTELCPSLLVKWNEKQKNQVRVDVHLSSSYNFYDINSLVFDIDGKQFTYNQLKLLRKRMLVDLFLSTRRHTLLFQVNSYRNLKMLKH